MFKMAKKSAVIHLPLERVPAQSRSQSMPVRGLCSGMTLGKSNFFIQNKINGAYAFIAFVYSAY